MGRVPCRHDGRPRVLRIAHTARETYAAPEHLAPYTPGMPDNEQTIFEEALESLREATQRIRATSNPLRATAYGATKATRPGLAARPTSTGNPASRRVVVCIAVPV